MTAPRAITERPRQFSSWIFEPRALLAAWSAFMVAAILTAPLATTAGRAEGWMLYSAFDPICHQDAERSWQLHGMPLAVCVRCFGVYAGVLTAALIHLKLPVKTLPLAIGLTAGSWIVEFFGLAIPVAEIRFVTGLALGITMGAVVLCSLSER